MKNFSEQEVDSIMKKEMDVFEKKGLLVDPFARALEMRPLMVKDGKFLVSDFTGSSQLKDIRVRTDSYIDKDLFEKDRQVKLLYRSNIWIKPLDKRERIVLGLPPLDLSDLEALEELTRDDKNFDLNLCFGPVEQLLQYNLPFAFQSLGCNLHGPIDLLGCYFCFVDRFNNVPELSQGRGAWVDEQNIVNTYEAARSDPDWIRKNNLEWVAERGGLNHIRHSGGQTTSHLDLTLRIANELKKRGLPVKLMYDTNLSTANAIRYWIDEGTYPKNILQQLGKNKVCLLTAFKGTDDTSIQYSTQSTLNLEQQFDELAMHVDAGEFCYPYVYNGNPYKLNELVDQGMDRFENFLPMLHLATIGMYGPTEEHMRLRARIVGENEQAYVAFQKELMEFLHAKSAEVINERCLKELDVLYRRTSRREVVQELGGLRVKK